MAIGASAAPVALEENGQPYRVWRAPAQACPVRHRGQLMRQRPQGEPPRRRRRPYWERPGRHRFPSQPPLYYGTAPRQGASARWHRSVRVVSAGISCVDGPLQASSPSRGSFGLPRNCVFIRKLAKYSSSHSCVVTMARGPNLWVLKRPVRAAVRSVLVLL